MLSIMASLPPHSADEAQLMEPAQQNLYFEGFLRKRKDTMKFTWAKYWFRLQNTTLYFFTKRDAQPACLRGQYYMYSVQSVRSVTSLDGDFTFEMVMKNGKRKLLSAESENLRDVWIKLLWKSMQLPGPDTPAPPAPGKYDIPELIQHSLHINALQTQSDEVSHNPPECAPQNGVSSAVDEDFPQCTDQTGSEEETSSDSDIYDVPRPLILSSAPPVYSALPGGNNTVGAEPQYMAMTDLNSYDSPAPVTSQGVSGSVTTSDP